MRALALLPPLCCALLAGCPRQGPAPPVQASAPDAGGAPAAQLQGGEWRAVGDSALGAQSTLSFDDDGRVSGATSCNRYTASYAVEGERLQVSSVATTRKACEEEAMAQESAFLVLLQQVQRYALTADGALLLHTAEGRTLRAERAADAGP